MKESDVVIPDGDVESSSDDDDDDDDDGNEDSDDDDDEELEEAEEEAGGAGVNAEIEREADEEDNVEIAAKNGEEDQQTGEFENQVNLVDEKSNLSKVSYIYISLPLTHSK